MSLRRHHKYLAHVMHFDFIHLHGSPNMGCNLNEKFVNLNDCPLPLLQGGAYKSLLNLLSIFHFGKWNVLTYYHVSLQ